MKLMTRNLLLFACCGAFACAADLSTAHNVYVMPMTRGMDQFLAVGLTREHVLQVVTDGKVADVVLTDHIGPAFEAQLLALNPPPAPAAEKGDEDEAVAKTPSMVSMFTDAANQSHPMAPSPSFSRTRGTVFLVDAKTHEVLWSTYAPSKDVSPKALDHSANEVVDRLKKDLNSKKK
jgi:hypothetical protein